MRNRPQTLRRALLEATRTMVQGGLSATTRRCGKPTCACAHDRAARHGPHLYLTYQDDGASRSLYVPPDQAAVAEAAREAWAAFWAIGCAIATENREALRRQWQQTTGRPARGSRRKAAGRD
jgi:hypothetical protein